MRFPIKIFQLAFLAVAVFAPAGRAAQTVLVASAKLRALAAPAREPSGWEALRRYAATEAGPGEKALAYFVLGYREFEAQRFAEAGRDLERASRRAPPLAGFAEYFRAAVLRASGQPGEAADLVANFSTRFPQNALRLDAVALLAQCLTDSGQPERALEVLAKEPSAESRPSLLFAKARALRGLARNEQAVVAFEQVYCRFPTSHESAEAELELEKLRSELGGGLFREPSPGLLTARAETLLVRERTREALSAFDKALEIYPESPEVPRWKVGRAKSLLQLWKSEEALDVLQAPFASDAAMDAERLAALVDAYAERGNSESMRVIVEQLGAVYPKSQSYAGALASVAGYYRRRSDWKSAEPFYKILANSFANAAEADEARWQLGWTAYVSQNPMARHVPDALYWLGRLAESGGAVVEAQALYQTLATHYTHNYFGGEAAKRLKALPATLPSEPENLSRAWAGAAALPKLIPLPPPAPPWLCTVRPSESDAALGAVGLLESLSLSDLADTYLRSLLSGKSASAEFNMALGRIEAQQGEVARSLLAVGKAFPRYEELDFSRTPRELWDLLFPRPYWNIVRQEAGLKGLSPYLVMGLIRQESAFNPNARSVANARGLMQILPQTASPRRSGRQAVTRRLADASFNVRFGSSYLEHLLQDYHGIPEYAVAAYHAGKTNVDEWLANNSFREPPEFLEAIPIPATRIYVEHVLRDARVYRDLMAGDPAFRRCP
ncbi:MAG: hypothetical protein DMG21_05715 [Acidobacteria bacterium]|nr:MAG: hypothetical protein DMG21_05715 [Acidobacteriota bacterium]